MTDSIAEAALAFLDAVENRMGVEGEVQRTLDTNRARGIPMWGRVKATAEGMARADDHVRETQKKYEEEVTKNERRGESSGK